MALARPDPGTADRPEYPAARPGPHDVGGRAVLAGRTVLDAGDLARALTRIAHQILERNRGSADLLLLGIPTRGVPLAARLAGLLERFDTDRPVSAGPVAHGSLDIGLFRDDVRLRPARTLAPTDVGSRGVDGTVVVLVDDVLFSGRSARAALSALDEFGRPRAVQLAVLVDRGHRELPIRADYVGKNLPTARTEQVRVRLVETDGVDAVTLVDAVADPETDSDPDPDPDPERDPDPAPDPDRGRGGRRAADLPETRRAGRTS